MIVGGGLLASAFDAHAVDAVGATVFASGVSNSNEENRDAFAREERLLRHHLLSSHGAFVYFSTCSIDDPDRGRGAYAIHKAKMEKLVEERPDSLILRLPQVVGRTENPNTLTNYIARHILEGLEFTIWKDAIRCLVDVEHVEKVTMHLLSREEERNITEQIAPPETLSMASLVALMESALGRSALTRTISRSGGSVPDSALLTSLAPTLEIDVTPGYSERLLHKYYGSNDAV